MLKVNDEQVFCHGYLLDRRSLDLFFKGGKVVREVSESRSEGKKIISHVEFDDFEVTKLLDGYKRVYKSDTNELFVDMMNSFSLMAKVGTI